MRPSVIYLPFFNHFMGKNPPDKCRRGKKSVYKVLGFAAEGFG